MNKTAPKEIQFHKFSFSCNSFTKQNCIPTYLSSMKAMLAILTLMVVSNSSDTKLINIQETQCSNDNDCPTWFICNKQNNCECGDRHQGRIACDNNSQISAVLECNCVTYDGENTFLGSCFYNCKSHYDVLGVKHMTYQQLPEKTETLLNLSICTFFTEPVYCVVTVKLDTVH